MGAWIETKRQHAYSNQQQSRPAWARGLKLYNSPIPWAFIDVAPRMGAWIETNAYAADSIGVKSRPAWARGLKHIRKTRHKIRLSRAPHGRVD